MHVCVCTLCKLSCDPGFDLASLIVENCPYRLIPYVVVVVLSKNRVETLGFEHVKCCLIVLVPMYHEIHAHTHTQTAIHTLAIIQFKLLIVLPQHFALTLCPFSFN